jgi:hypothetical protein
MNMPAMNRIRHIFIFFTSGWSERQAQRTPCNVLR